MKKRYQALMAHSAINENETWNADGCCAYSIFNAGNVNVTIDGITVIKPRETFQGPQMVHPEVGFYNKHKIEFDQANAPTFKTPIGGVEPPSVVINPGDPAPGVDKRVIIFRVDIK